MGGGGEEKVGGKVGKTEVNNYASNIMQPWEANHQLCTPCCNHDKL